MKREQHNARRAARRSAKAKERREAYRERKLGRAQQTAGSVERARARLYQSMVDSMKPKTGILPRIVNRLFPGIARRREQRNADEVMKAILGTTPAIKPEDAP